MNKTISVNIGGFVFHIEEQAYAELRQYLEAISNGIPLNEGRQEIMSDIEARIAEIFKEALQASKKEVVVAADVKSAINTMGRPEEITDPFQQATDQKENSFSTTYSRSYKMLYRDGDERILGGVCSGLGHYFGLNPIMFRAAFVIAFVFWGSGLLLYLILLLIIPKAKTTAEKLEMRGRPVNLKEIRKNVEEEFGEIGKNAEAGYKNLESEIKNSNWQQRVNGFFDMLGVLLSRLFKIVAKFFAVIIWFISVVLLLSLTATLFAKIFGFDFVSTMNYDGNEFFDGANSNLFLMGIVLLIGTPAFALTYITTKFIFGIKKSFKPMPWILSVLFFAGLVCAMIATISTANDFKSKSIVSNRLPMNQPQSDTLVVAMSNRMDDDSYADEDIIHISTPYFSDSIDAGKVKWELVSTLSDTFELQETRIARGRNDADAKGNGSQVVYQLSQTGDTLFLDPGFTLKDGSKFRFQKLRISLAVPKGKSVKILHPANRHLRKIDGYGDDFEKRDAIGVWKNSDNGITCTDCPKEQSIDSENEKRPASMDIRVDTSGVRIKMEQ